GAGWVLIVAWRRRLLGISDFGFRISDGRDRETDGSPVVPVPKSEIRNPKSEIAWRLAALAALWGIGALCLFGALCWIVSQGTSSSPLARAVTATYLPIFSAEAPTAL